MGVGSLGCAVTCDVGVRVRETVARDCKRRGLTCGRLIGRLLLVAWSLCVALLLLAWRCGGKTVEDACCLWRGGAEDACCL